MKLKQKSVTMWAIWDPYFNLFLVDTFSSQRGKSWKKFYDNILNSQFSKKDVKKHGFRAVKGRFVWEEK